MYGITGGFVVIIMVVRTIFHPIIASFFSELFSLCGTIIAHRAMLFSTLQ